MTISALPLPPQTAVVSPPVDALDVEAVRRDFPILRQTVRGKPLVYLDNAATTQKPRAVIGTISEFYGNENASVHRGVHFLSQQATFAFERARGRIGKFLNAGDSSEIIFVRGATEGINLVANGYGRPTVGPGDEIIISHMEHHSNIVPWQMLCEEKGATLRVIPVDDGGELVLEEYERLLGDRTRLVAVTHASNALGTVNPIEQMIATAHARGVPVLIDGAQGVPHMRVDVRQLDCDFYVFSGHKLFGPTGIGVLYGKRNLLDDMEPYQGGGSMIKSVTLEKTTFADVPTKFEAGTPNIAGAVGLAAAIDYVNDIGLDRIERYESTLLDYATQRLEEVPGLRFIGTASEKVSVISFVMGDAHPHDIGTILDAEGIAIRTGHHCAQPLMQRYQVAATARASLAFYNTRSEIDALVNALFKVNEVLG
jgi:cysteine desulfurase/selenocysteine lyase